MIGLNPAIEADLIARVFRTYGRVHVSEILDTQSAARIHHVLATETAWQSVLFDGTEHRDLPVAALAELPEPERKALLAATDAAAARGFSYRYSNFRLFENMERGLHLDSYLMRVLAFLNSAPFIELMRRITGDPGIDYADGQATLYRPGDFLTCHDDNVEGKDRRAAYVLGFTPEWKADWGGLLAFPDERGHLSEAYAPAFNSLNLFRVPMLHAVTQVASFATAPRYSITGWLRRRPAAA